MIVLSLLLLALGAISRYAVTDRWEDINMDTLGMVLMLVGLFGLVYGLIRAAILSEPYERRLDLRDDVDDPDALPIRRTRRRFFR